MASKQRLCFTKSYSVFYLFLLYYVSIEAFSKMESEACWFMVISVKRWQTVLQVTVKASVSNMFASFYQFPGSCGFVFF